MVTEKIIDWLCELLLGLWNVETTADPVDVVSSVAEAYKSLAALNYFLPIGETIATVSLALAAGPPMLATTVALWLGVGVVRGGQSRI